MQQGGFYNVRANPNDWARQGQGMMSIAAGMSNAADILQDRENRLTAEKRTLEIENYFANDFDPAETEVLTKAQTQRGGAAVGVTEKTKEWYKEQEDRLNKFTAEMGPYMQRRAIEKFHARRNSTLKSVGIHEARQRDQWKRDTLKASGESGLNTILTRAGDDSVLFNQIKDFQDLAVESLPESEVDQVVGVYRNVAASTAIYGLLDKDRIRQKPACTYVRYR